MEKELLTRGVEKIYPTVEALEEELQSGKKLRIYNGIDPTGKLHLGHAVIFKKLRQFQDLGHEIVILIGDFTARIGDPTDKLATRRQLSREEIEKNARDYKKIIGKILNTEKANLRFLHNEEWTNKLKPEDLLELASHFTVPQLLERDMFQERIKQKKEIYLHEFMYPIFQAYDAVTMDVDLQIGGSDQTFNMLAGRTLMKKMKSKEKFVLTMKMLADPTGKKMSKTGGGIVALDAEPDEMFGAIMAWPDELIESGFELLTDLPMSEIEEMNKEMPQNLNPRDAKVRLAKEIVSLLHGSAEAKKAAEEFEKVFQKKELPEDIVEIELSGTFPLPQFLVETRLVASNSEARRLIEAGAVEIDSARCGDYKSTIATHPGMVVKVGKRRFAKIK